MVSGRSPHTYVKFTAFAAAVEPLHLNEESFIYADATQVASWGPGTGHKVGTRWAEIAAGTATRRVADLFYII